MASFAVLVFLLFAGIDYGTQPEAEFNEVEMALENAVAGSESTLRWKQMYCTNGPGVYEICFYTGDGNSCSTWGEVTRDC